MATRRGSSVGGFEALLVVGPHQVRKERRVLVAGLRELLGPDGPFIIDQPSPTQIVARPESLVLLVVPEGIGYSSLHRQADRYLDGRGGGVLLVRGHSRQFLQRRPWHLPPEQPRRTPSAAGVGDDGSVRVTARD